MIIVEEQTSNLATCLKTAIHRYLETDDVYREEFLDGLLIACQRPDKIELGSEILELLEEWKCSWHEVISRDLISATDIPHRALCGPVALQNNIIHEVWRVFNDSNHAFLASIWPSLSAPG